MALNLCFFLPELRVAIALICLLKLDLSLAKFIDMCLLINIVNFVLLSLVKLGYSGIGVSGGLF